MRVTISFHVFRQINMDHTAECPYPYNVLKNKFEYFARLMCWIGKIIYVVFVLISLHCVILISEIHWDFSPDTLHKHDVFH